MMIFIAMRSPALLLFVAAACAAVAQAVHAAAQQADHHHHHQHRQHLHDHDRHHRQQQHQPEQGPTEAGVRWPVDELLQPWQSSLPPPPSPAGERHHLARHKRHHQHHRQHEAAAAAPHGEGVATALPPAAGQHAQRETPRRQQQREDDDDNEHDQIPAAAGEDNGVEPFDYDEDELNASEEADKSVPLKNSQSPDRPSTPSPVAAPQHHHHHGEHHHGEHHQERQQPAANRPPRQHQRNQLAHQPAEVSSDSGRALDPSRLSAYPLHAHGRDGDSHRQLQAGAHTPASHSRWQTHHRHNDGQQQQQHRQADAIHAPHANAVRRQLPAVEHANHLLAVDDDDGLATDDYYDDDGESKDFEDLAAAKDYDSDREWQDIGEDEDDAFSDRPSMRVTRDHRQHKRPYQENNRYNNYNSIQYNELDYANDEPFREAPSSSSGAASAGGDQSAASAVGDLTQQKINELGTKEAVKQSHSNYQAILSSKEQTRLQRLFQQHQQRVLNATKCRLPQPRVVPIIGETSKLYQPSCTVVHRCGPDTGCCADMRQVCTNRSYELIHVYVAAYNTDTNRREIEMKTFENHTECGCRNRSRAKRSELELAWLHDRQQHGREQSDGQLQQDQYQQQQQQQDADDCHCPTHFNAFPEDQHDMAMGHDLAWHRAASSSSLSLLHRHGQQHHQPQSQPQQCRCNCAPGHTPCLRLHRGEEGFAIEDRKCIAERRCQLPMCLHGVYNELTGRCPRLRRHKRTVTHHNYGIG